MRDFDDEEVLLLPMALVRRFQAAGERGYQGIGPYLLGELLDRIQPLIAHLAEPIPYRATWRHQRYWERDAYERGVLIADRWLPPPHLDGCRVYLRHEGYALIFRELNRTGPGHGHKEGSWQAVLRPLPLADAAAALGGNQGILEVLEQLAPRIAALTKIKDMGSRAGRLAYWCRYVPPEVRKLKMV